MKCEICCVQPQTSLLTRCCKLFICQICKQKYEKVGTCVCGKAINKKLCNSSPQIFDIIKNYYQGKPQQCDRCDKNAQFTCLNCNMIFCEQCNTDIHDAKGFAKHNREVIKKQIKSPKKLIQRAKRRQEWCAQHKIILDSVCQCGQFLCANCLKTHKQSCHKFTKVRNIKQYKQQFFSQILYKIKKITQYKQKLLADHLQYKQHFQKQKQAYEGYTTILSEQLEGLRKIVELKISETKNKLLEYWKQCVEAYTKNEYMIELHLKKFDDLGRLSQKFIQKNVGLQYLEKRVKRVYVNHDFFNFKINGIDQVQYSAINISFACKPWQISNNQSITLNFQHNDQKALKQKRYQLNSALPAANSQIFLHCTKNPLNHRPLLLKSSHSQISFEFLHLPYQNDDYQIQYGVGLKMKGHEVFKKIENKNGIGIINNLNPSTKYRVRMRVGKGQWGPINQIKTQQMPRFITQLCTNSKHTQQAVLQTLKTGTIYGSNQINFGVHTWQIKIFPPKNTDQQTACLSIGVSNKQQKKPVFTGTTLNYGYQKALITVRICLNCDENKMSILSSTGIQEQVYQNLPNFPLYPTIQNKGSYPVQIQCFFQ